MDSSPLTNDVSTIVDAIRMLQFHLQRGVRPVINRLPGTVDQLFLLLKIARDPDLLSSDDAKFQALLNQVDEKSVLNAANLEVFSSRLVVAAMCRPSKNTSLLEEITLLRDIVQEAGKPPLTPHRHTRPLSLMQLRYFVRRI